MRCRALTGVVVSLLLLVAVVRQGQAETIAYWRCEHGGADDTLLDRAGGDDNALAHKGKSAVWTGTGLYADTVPQNNLSNTNALDQSAGPSPAYFQASDHERFTPDQNQGFTVEAFVEHRKMWDDQMVAQHWNSSYGNEADCAWQLGIDADSHPFLNVYDGSTHEQVFTDFTLTAEQAYALAGVFDPAEDQLRMYVKTPGDLNYQSQVATILGLGGLNNSSQELILAANENSNYPFSGYLDEVRFSTGVLSEAELLATPEPSTTCLAVVSAAAGLFTLWRRKRKKLSAEERD